MNNRDKKILGIDIGYARMGWCIMYDNKTTGKYFIIDTGLIETTSSTMYKDRLNINLMSLKKIIEYYKPDIIAIENIYFFKNKKTILGISSVKGLLVYLANIYSISLFEYTPLQIKLSITGYGMASKNEVLKFVKISTGIKNKFLVRKDDLVDSIAVCLCHIQNENKNSV